MSWPLFTCRPTINQLNPIVLNNGLGLPFSAGELVAVAVGAAGLGGHAEDGVVDMVDERAGAVDEVAGAADDVGQIPVFLAAGFDTRDQAIEAAGKYPAQWHLGSESQERFDRADRGHS